MLKQLQQLKSLLLLDKSALFNRDYAKLSDASTKIEGLTEELRHLGAEISPEEAELLIEVKELASRNASLFSAGIEGAKAAREKLEEIRRATSELHTYSSDGQVENVGPKQVKIEKRA